MRLHLLGIPHTVTRADFSSCAFTQKVRRFAPMMRPFGYEVIHYGVAGAESGADEQVDVMGQDEHQALLGHPYHAQNATGGFYGDDAVDESAVYRQFNLYLREHLKERVQPGDLILLPFGHAHGAAVRGLPVLKAGAGAIESGIGYLDCLLPWRIYESESCKHMAMGKEGRWGVHEHSPRLEFVCPNYYDPDEWPEGDGGDAIVYLGRLTEGKGLRIVLDVARARPDVPFRIAGQGDISQFGPVPDNVEVLGPLTDRRDYLGNARAILAPSRYPEPFCGVVVEAALCGTPAITTSFGAMTETVEQGQTGFRGQTMREWLDAVDAVTALDRGYVRQRAQARYTLAAVGREYHRAFQVVQERLASFPHAGW
jgi:glycosyltransferase involved in cell wall biosynthesis